MPNADGNDALSTKEGLYEALNKYIPPVPMPVQKFLYWLNHPAELSVQLRRHINVYYLSRR